MNKKAYYTFSDYLKEEFGEKVYKITIDAGFSCPNRDGTISKGGCIFCDESGIFSKAHTSELDVQNQVKTGITTMNKRFGENKFLNEIIWQYSWGSRTEKQWNKKHDSIYLY